MSNSNGLLYGIVAGVTIAALFAVVAVIMSSPSFSNNESNSQVAQPTTNISQQTQTTSTTENTISQSSQPSTTEYVSDEIVQAGTLTSVQDPGQGHESHQLAIILPPTGKTYSGVLTYDASENVQLVALHGPLGPGEDKGQAIWTPDGTTKYALTFVDPQNSAGTWQFTGDALAVHTLHTTPFQVSYSVKFTQEDKSSNSIKTGTLTSVQDPGQGHESHQLAIILPPT
ncbi:MAG: copper-binding protein, partial [Thaumarchaeota archaeon]|nr:copper-binding protein [Nitrososphaerota archaeon]